MRQAYQPFYWHWRFVSLAWKDSGYRNIRTFKYYHHAVQACRLSGTYCRNYLIENPIWVCIFVSPIEALDSRHRIEVPVLAQERKTMLSAERGDPEVIGWNGLSCLSQLNTDGCVVVCSLRYDIQHRAIGD